MEDRKQVEQIYRAITGCGVPTSEMVVAGLSDHAISQIVAADGDGRRGEVRHIVDTDNAAETKEPESTESDAE